jgi:hypothetical protein
MHLSLLRNEYGRMGIHKLDRWDEVWDQLTAPLQHNTITKSQVVKSYLIKLVAKYNHVDLESWHAAVIQATTFHTDDVLY